LLPATRPLALNRTVFVTGLSGAGKSQTMKTFEDLGFYCLDNLPPILAPRLLELLDAAQVNQAAITLDVRNGGPFGEALPVLEQLSKDAVPPEVLFLEARDEALIRRYSETRRKHPFASAGHLAEAIATERAALATLRERATRVIDTSNLTHASLKERIISAYAPSAQDHRLQVGIVAFGFKYGLPLDLDLLFDVRFLTNPNYVSSLKPLTGADPRVAKYIETDPATEPFLEHLFRMVEFLIPRYMAEGKSALTIGIGCTGGRHRSVYIARRLRAHLEVFGDLQVALDSRDSTR